MLSAGLSAVEAEAVVEKVKLYWRVKRNGKWTWVAATHDNTLWNCSEPWNSEYLGDEEE